MARKSGKAILFKRGNPAVTIILQTDITVEVNREAIEDTTKDDNYRHYLPGDHPDWNVSGSATFDEANAGHDGLFDDLDLGTEQDFAVALDSKTLSGKGLVTQWQVQGADGSPKTLNFNIQGVGDPTYV